MAHIVLSGKPAGGYRPIALLPATCRIWSKIRVVHIRRWATQHARPYFAMGASKSTVDVAARVL
eukprot:7748392-Pyramimonas_sp.AAC.1